MHDVLLRRVQKHRSTMEVSLPPQVVEKLKLKKGDYVEFEFNGKHPFVLLSVYHITRRDYAESNRDSDRKDTGGRT